MVKRTLDTHRHVVLSSRATGSREGKLCQTPLLYMLTQPTTSTSNVCFISNTTGAASFITSSASIYNRNEVSEH